MPNNAPTNLQEMQNMLEQLRMAYGSCGPPGH